MQIVPIMILLEMDIVMMKLILRNATTIVVTVAELVLLTQNIVQNVYVTKEVNQWLTFHVSDFIMIDVNHKNHSLTDAFTVNIGCDTPIELIGNGVCINEALNEDCNYDGGDCK